MFKAYRTVCDKCAHEGPDGKRKLCTKCGIDCKIIKNSEGKNGYAKVISRNQKLEEERAYEQDVVDVQYELEGLRLRERVKVERLIRAGKIVWRNDKFVYADDEDKPYESKEHNKIEAEESDNSEIDTSS